MQTALAKKNRFSPRFQAPAPARARAHTSIRNILRGSHVQRKSKSGTAGEGRERPAPRNARFGENCSDWHQCEILRPLAIAETMTDSAIRELAPIAAGTTSSGRIFNLLRVHFHTPDPADAATILDNFRAIRAELGAPIRYICRPDKDVCKTEKGVVHAATGCSLGADIELCPLYFVGADCNDQARSLLHEIAHHVDAICPDFAYVHEAASYMSLPKEEAMRNADTYAQFALMVRGRQATCVDCSLES